MGTDVLFLRLEGPLQSWGERARWVERDTRREPTKSGVVGLIACCLGWPRNDPRIADLAASVRMGVRVDRPGTVVRDFHTVTGVRKADGGLKEKAGRLETVVSWRSYLAGAVFLVALEGSAETLDRIEAALRQPVWPPFLGRKSCPPSAPIYPAWPDAPSRRRGVDLETALREAAWLVTPSSRTTRAVIEARPGDHASTGVLQRRNDVPIAPAAQRYTHRSVIETTLEVVA